MKPSIPTASGLSMIGQRRPRLDGRGKVSGRAVFTDDLELPGMLYGKILRSPHARARITKLDISRALALPGVKAIVTAADSGSICVQPGQPVFCGEIANYIGEEIAAVAAIDELTAEQALNLVEIAFEPLPAATTLRQATRPKAPRIHPEFIENTAGRIAVDFGTPEPAFQAADFVFDDKFGNAPTHNVLSEFHIAVVDFSNPDKLTMWTPLQSPVNFTDSLTREFKLTPSQVQLIFLNTGGAFTGRGQARSHHFIAALLSRKAGRPVKLRADGDEEFTIYPAAGEGNFYFRTAVDADGRIRGLEIDMLTECGAHAGIQSAMHHMSSNYVNWLYKVEGVRFRSRAVLTNSPPYFCHHGGPMAPMSAGWMQHLTRVAEQLGIDPIDFHIRNVVTKDHQTFDGAVFGSCGLVECLERARDRSGWRDKYGKLPPLHGIGVGIGAMAVGMKKKRPFDASAIFIKIAEDGIVTLFTGIPDMGQGSHTAMAMIAAEVLGIDTSDIRIVAGDTDITPFDLGAFAQRGTFVTGNAVIAACNDAKAQLAQLAGKSFGVPASGIEFSGRRVHVRGNPENGMDFRELVRSSLFSVEGRVIMGRGYYNTPVPQGPQGAAAYSFGAQIAEVRIDADTGKVTLLKVTVAHDIGRAINPLAVEGQIDGQVFSGMSQVLFEECIMKDGQVMNPSRLEYKLPRTYELPEIDYIIVETIDPYGPFGAKEVGEGPIVVSMGAIATAVSNAVGCIMPEMPMTPWAVLRALSQRSNEARSR